MDSPAISKNNLEAIKEEVQNNMEGRTKHSELICNKRRALVAYWILGLCNNYGYVVMLSAANDILHEQGGATNDTVVSGNSKRKCNYLSTGTILLADILPSLLIKLIAPFLPFFIDQRIGVTVSLQAAGYLLVALSSSQWMSVLGVIVTSLSSGLGEVSLLQYSSFYSKNVVSTWSSGTGGAGIFGSISYAALNKLGLRNALLIMFIVPVLMTVSFWVILPRPTDLSRSNLDLQHSINKEEIQSPKLVFKKKLFLIPGLLKYMLPLGLIYFFEYLINQGMFELINFEDIFIDQDEQYRWLQVDYQIGVFISRSSVNLVHINKIWIMAIFQMINVGIFSLEVIYYLIPHFWIVLCLTLWEGLLGGAAYVNTFYKISIQVEEENKQFSMATTSFADSIGITFAGILSILAHNRICALDKPERSIF